MTKPIQLLAAWLAGLVIIDGMFLGAAASLDTTSWPHGALVAAAIFNVPIFLGAIFLLQTRFRAELQEDFFYSEYLSKRTSAVVRVEKNADQDARIEALEVRLLELTTRELPPKSAPSMEEESGPDWSEWRIAVNDYHPMYHQVMDSLNAAGIPVAGTFGHGSASSPPTRWVVSINWRMPVENKVALLRALLPFRFAGFQLWDPRPEADENEDVYVGGYGSDPIARITPKFDHLVATNPSENELLSYYHTHGGG